ncbi:MAG: DUF4476 domain-containing protein [Bacteroidales bacterium]|nr:DUF4476 domain-containing protein [Bacteroidales bacterium]
MKTTITFLLLILSVLAFSQTNDITVFSEKGENFTLFVNSIKQNDVPKANVTAKDLRGENFVLRVVFEDNSIPELTQNIWTESKDVELTAVIKLNKKGKYVIRYNGETPRVEKPDVEHTDTYVNYEDPNSSSNTSTNTGVTNQTETVVTTTTVTTNTNDPGFETDEDVNVTLNVSVDENGMTTTTGVGEESLTMDVSVDDNGMSVNTGVGGESFGMDVDVSENGMDMNTGVGDESVSVNFSVNGTGMDTNVQTSESTTITTTTTTTTSTSGFETDSYEVEETETYVAPATSRCSYAMSSSEFDEALASIKSKSFEDSKLTTAKQICKNECLTAEQIRDINKAFSFEETRLEFAKYAYDYVYDASKYYKVNDSFTFEMTIEELDEYLETK